MAGWQKVYRDIQKHWLWEDKPFSRGQAFIDLILLVNHQDSKVLIDGELIEVKRGSKVTSLRKLGEAWGWSSKKVKKFLEQLEKDNMISYKSDNKKTVVTIENYSVYQDVGNSEETVEKHQGNSEETQRNFKGNSEEIQRKTNKKDKEDIKNSKNDQEGEEGEEITPPSPQSLSIPTKYHKLILDQWAEATYRTWFMDSEIVEDGQELIIKVDSELRENAINLKYSKHLGMILGKNIKVEIREDI